jgi:hypothetical protein
LIKPMAGVEVESTFVDRDHTGVNLILSVRVS